MKYLNISSSVDQSEHAMRASLDQLGAWLILQCYCHRQMNGGKIVNCRDWPESAWQRLGLSHALIMAESPMWHFSGVENNALVVHIYDTSAESAYRRKLEAGVAFAEKRWKTKRKKTDLPEVENGSPNGSPIGSPIGSAMGHPMRKEVRKEGRSI